MKSLAPETFFTGAQRDLARAIAAPDPAAVRALAPKTDLDTPGAQDMTLPMFAALWAQERPSEPARFAVVTELVRAGADVRREVPDFTSALGLALLAESPDLLRAMLDGGISPDVRVGSERSTPALFVAASEESVPGMMLLLDRGAEVNAKDPLGTTAILYALRAMQLDQVEQLLDRGADPRAVTRLGVSFAYALSTQMARQIPGSPALAKMTSIRDRIAREGVAWPPAPPEVEREHMRERGEEPIVPTGQPR